MRFSCGRLFISWEIGSPFHEAGSGMMQRVGVQFAGEPSYGVFLSACWEIFKRERLWFVIILPRTDDRVGRTASKAWSSPTHRSRSKQASFTPEGRPNGAFLQKKPYCLTAALNTYFAPMSRHHHRPPRHERFRTRIFYAVLVVAAVILTAVVWPH